MHTWGWGLHYLGGMANAAFRPEEVDHDAKSACQDCPSGDCRDRRRCSGVGPRSGPDGPEPSWGGGLLLVVVVAALLAVLITAIRLYDMKRRQEDSAMLLQAKLSDALLQEPSLARSPITATVYAPLRKRSPITVDIAGPVSSPELRDTAIRIVSRETAGLGREIQIEDRLLVNPMQARHAA